jgi:nucleoid-associated protein YgaU
MDDLGGNAVADPTPAPANAYAQWHVVAKGETLGKIAEKYYGDPSLYTQIVEANKDLIKNPDVIQIGWKLRIP